MTKEPGKFPWLMVFINILIIAIVLYSSLFTILLVHSKYKPISYFAGKFLTLLMSIILDETVNKTSNFLAFYKYFLTVIFTLFLLR